MRHENLVWHVEAWHLVVLICSDSPSKHGAAEHSFFPLKKGKNGEQVAGERSDTIGPAGGKHERDGSLAGGWQAKAATSRQGQCHPARLHAADSGSAAQLLLGQLGREGRQPGGHASSHHPGLQSQDSLASFLTMLLQGWHG